MSMGRLCASEACAGQHSDLDFWKPFILCSERQGPGGNGYEGLCVSEVPRIYHLCGRRWPLPNVLALVSHVHVINNYEQRMLIMLSMLCWKAMPLHSWSWGTAWWECLLSGTYCCIHSFTQRIFTEHLHSIILIYYALLELGSHYCHLKTHIVSF